MFRHLIAIAAAFFTLSAFAAVDANQGSRAELESVKGIGPGLSGKIVEARKAGSFKDWGDLVDRVGGIGPGNASKLSQNGLTVAGSAYDGAAATATKGSNGPKGEKQKKTGKASQKAKHADAAASSM